MPQPKSAAFAYLGTSSAPGGKPKVMLRTKFRAFAHLDPSRAPGLEGARLGCPFKISPFAHLTHSDAQGRSRGVGTMPRTKFPLSRIWAHLPHLAWNLTDGFHQQKVRPCRADLPSGLAGTLYEYTSILREPGGQAQEESAGQHRVLSLLRWSTRAIGSGFLVRSRCL